MQWDLKDNQIRPLSNSYFNWAEKRIRKSTNRSIQIEMTGDFWDSEEAMMVADLRGANKIAHAISQVCIKKQRRIIFCAMRVDKIVLNNQPAGKRNVAFRYNEMVISCAFTDSKDHFSVDDLREILDKRILSFLEP